MRFHKQIWIPDHVRIEAQFKGSLSYTAHAKKAAKTDKYGKLPILKEFDSDKAELVEVEYNKEGAIEKNLFRVPFTDELDMVLAVVPSGIVKTVWANRKHDSHASLKLSRYQQPT